MHSRNLWHVFRIPLLLTLLSGIGLIAALISDGLGDALSWIALGCVICVAIGYRPYKANASP